MFPAVIGGTPASQKDFLFDFCFYDGVSLIIYGSEGDLVCAHLFSFLFRQYLVLTNSVDLLTNDTSNIVRMFWTRRVELHTNMNCPLTNFTQHVLLSHSVPASVRCGVCNVT